MTETGELIAGGRSADIYAHGPGRVLRRRRGSPINVLEPAVMRAVRAAGYPVPEVFSVDGHEMVLERVDGVDALSDLEHRPWRAWRVGAMLADLHVRLGAVALGPDVIEAGEIPVAYGAPEVFVHGDLHPGNVILTDHGPVVIDWERARLGPADAEVASTWLLLEIGQLDDMPMLVRPIAGLLRRCVRYRFLRGVPAPSRSTVRAMCESRLADPNMRPVELRQIREFMVRHG